MAKTSLQASLDVVDTSARSISTATAILMKSASWLQLCEVQLTEESLPFDGYKFFADCKDDLLYTLSDSRATLRFSVICTPANKRKFSRSQLTQRSCPVQFSSFCGRPAKSSRFSKKKP